MLCLRGCQCQLPTGKLATHINSIRILDGKFTRNFLFSYKFARFYTRIFLLLVQPNGEWASKKKEMYRNKLLWRRRRGTCVWNDAQQEVKQTKTLAHNKTPHRMEIHCLFAVLASITNDQLLINQSFSLYRQVQSFYAFINRRWIRGKDDEKWRFPSQRAITHSAQSAQPSVYSRNSLNNCSENILLRFVCGPINWFVSRFMHQFEL